ncbi:MAG: 6-phosphofructokinase [Oscillospiraceae bacterium]|nr:6-phosphofructokinase [Oscillospiraceae bacterium]
MKKIGVLTSGGDAPGMNAAVRAVVRTACENGMEVVGIRRGYTGLINGDMVELNIRSVSDIIHRGGTILYSARCLEFKEEAGLQKAVQTCKDNDIEGIVVIGGDGSFRGARDLSLRGVPCIGVPGTIDNDIACTDYTIGYDTCLNTIMEMVDRVRDTTESHDRCSVIEVMGRRAGYLALNAGIAVGATTILVPEFDFDIERDVIERMRRTQKTGKRHFIIMVAEGIGGVEELARKIEAETQVESRAVILGHVQRGGAPTCKDRVVASQMGNRAVKLLLDGIGNRVVGMKNEQIFDMDIYEALSQTKTLDRELFDISYEISI